MVNYGTQVLTAAVLTPPLDLQSTGTTAIFGAGTTGDTNNRVQLGADGAIRLGSGAGATDTTISRSGANNVLIGSNCKIGAGGIDVITAGVGLKVAEGSNAKQGVATLAAGTVTVANTSVTASSRIIYAVQAPGGTQGTLSCAATAGTGFTITSTNALDTSTIAYEIFEPG